MPCGCMDKKSVRCGVVWVFESQTLATCTLVEGPCVAAWLQGSCDPGILELQGIGQPEVIPRQAQGLRVSLVDGIGAHGASHV